MSLVMVSENAILKRADHERTLSLDECREDRIGISFSVHDVDRAGLAAK